MLIVFFVNYTRGTSDKSWKQFSRLYLSRHKHISVKRSKKIKQPSYSRSAQQMTELLCCHRIPPRLEAQEQIFRKMVQNMKKMQYVTLYFSMFFSYFASVLILSTNTFRFTALCNVMLIYYKQVSKENCNIPCRCVSCQANQDLK